MAPETLGANSIHYIVTPLNMNISGRTEVVATMSTVIEGDPVFQYKLNPNNLGDKPANVSLFLQRQGDDLTAEKQFYRWWSEPLTYKLEPGEATLTVPLSPDQWISVFGKSGAETPVEFQAALQNLGNIGMTFGGGSFKGHGVNIDKGSAVYSLHSMEIK